MPNWCMNTFVVEGEKRMVKTFSDKVKTKDTLLSLDTLVPMDKSLLVGDAWYHWCKENWGAKWDVYEVRGESHAEYQAYDFLSAWTPPIAWLERVAPQWTDLKFTLTYDEPNIGFRGVATGEKGVVKVVEEDYEYEDQDEERKMIFGNASRQKQYSI